MTDNLGQLITLDKKVTSKTNIMLATTLMLIYIEIMAM